MQSDSSACLLRVHPSGRLAAVATRERVCLWDLASAAPAQVGRDGRAQNNYSGSRDV